jgi:adenosylcobinamide-phosphate synthase
MSKRAAALLGAIALDAAFGEPGNHWHPVAATGRLLAAGYEPLRQSPRTRQLAGGAAALGGVALVAGGAAALVERLALRRGWVGISALALALKPAFAVRQLRQEALGVALALERGRLPEARTRLRALVSRPTSRLDAPLVAAAAIESLAENLADSIVAPWLYYAALGLPGAAIYRVVNTADAMYGYRGELEWLGKAAARSDDALNWLPSRASALALVLAASATLGVDAGRRALRAWREEAGYTESPNAGRPMAVMAGCLGRRLEKPGHYVLGAGYPPPGAADIRRAARLVRAAAGLTAAVVVAALLVRDRQ